MIYRKMAEHWLTHRTQNKRAVKKGGGGDGATVSSKVLASLDLLF